MNPSATSATSTETLPQTPGTEIIGRGLCLWPDAPYELKDHVWPMSHTTKVFHCSDTGRTYSLPENVEVNPSPPLPSDTVLGHTHIAESFEHLTKKVEVDTQVAGGNGPFTVDVNASQIQQLKTEERATYAICQNFLPLYEVYIPRLFTLDESVFDLEFPTPFDPKHKSTYERFFNRFGTHVVKRVWVGGKAMISLVTKKTESMSAEDIRRGLNVKAGAQSASEKAKLEEIRENLKSNADIMVLGEGGDKLKLGAMRSLNETAYNEWVETIKEHPRVIEMELVGIWNLFHDEEKANTLAKAYEAETNFEEVSSLLFRQPHLYIIRGSEFVCYHLEKNKVVETGNYSDLFPNMPERLNFDASFSWEECDGGRQEFREKVIFFKGREFMMFDQQTNQFDEGFPQPINGADEQGRPFWPGLTFERVDAAVNWGDGSVYLFSGNQYVRFNLDTHCVDPGYPRSLQPFWAGLPFERIDAVDTWNGRKAYFFYKNQYVRYDMAEYRVDPGYPKSLRGNYVEDWRID